MKRLCFDFDGVLYSYRTGYHGPTVLTDPPVPGMPELLQRLQAMGFRLVVHSTRTATEEGARAVNSWLLRWGFPADVMELSATKPPADLYVDDRGYRFEGDPMALIDYIMQNPMLGSWVSS